MAGAICCLLCLENLCDPIGHIPIDLKEGKALQAQQIIEKYFMEEVNTTLAKTRTVCRQCWETVSTFHQFYLRVQRAHIALVQYDIAHNSESWSEDGAPHACEEQIEERKVDIERLLLPPNESNIIVEELHINDIKQEEMEFAASSSEDAFVSRMDQLPKKKQKRQEFYVIRNLLWPKAKTSSFVSGSSLSAPKPTTLQVSKVWKSRLKAKRKRLPWDEGSELALLDMWPERIDELRKHKKNGHIYSKMADDLSKLGYSHSARDVQVKLQNFTQRYRKEKAAMGASGGSPSTWPYYARVHQIIGGFKANTFCELALKSINASSIGTLPLPSTPLPSSATPVPSPSTPLPSPSPPLPSTSASEPRGRKRRSDFHVTLLEKFEELSSDISKHLQKSEENEKELIKIEKEKAECLKMNTKENEGLKNAIISILKKV